MLFRSMLDRELEKSDPCTLPILLKLPEGIEGFLKVSGFPEKDTEGASGLSAEAGSAARGASDLRAEVGSANRGASKLGLSFDQLSIASSLRVISSALSVGFLAISTLNFKASSGLRDFSRSDRAFTCSL